MNTIPAKVVKLGKVIELGENLVLPASAVTDTFAFFGTRGTGKTYGAGRTVEAFHDLGAQFVVVDPVGVWYGLRLAADGRGRGLDIPVFGGIHADVPLEATGGELVARLVVEQRLSVVLDVSMMSLGSQHRFVLAFATALFNLKKSDRSPLFALFDEAHEFAPQTPGPQEAEMLSAVRRLWKMGRNFGIGVGLVSPRPAEVNKGLVDLTERMFCGRLKGPRDRKAMESWADSQEADHSALGQLATLPSGELMYWSDAGPHRVRFSKKRTFDASKTPEQGDARPAAALPKIDMVAVREAMAATIEEAKANDPRALRVRIAELEREIAKRPTTAPAPAAAKPKTVEVPVLREADVARIERLVAGLEAHDDTFLAKREKFSGPLRDAIGTMRGMLAAKAPRVDYSAAIPVIERKPPPPAVAKAIRAALEQPGPVISEAIPMGVRKVLVILAQFPEGARRKKVGIIAGYAPGGSTMRGILATIRRYRWAADAGDAMQITQEGRAAIAGFTWEPLPTGPQLRDHWLQQLPECPSTFLRVLWDEGPAGAITKQQLAEACARLGGTPYEVGGSTMRGGLAHLRGLDLIVDHGKGEGATMSASPDLFG